MKFWDREKEKEWLKRYLQTEPNAILFVYGPKSSGKTALLMKVVEELPKEEFIYYWFDLRGKLLSSYKDVIDMFFLDEESFKDLEEISKKAEGGVMSFFRVSVEKKEKIESRKIDAFEYMERVLRGHAEDGKKPVIVFDELQKLKEVYLNGQRSLVRELFNFFVRITKVLHLAHVIVMTSDTFFIEQVYTDSTLKNTSRFYLIDFFDDDTTKRILISEGLSEQDAQYVVDWIGGVPWMIEEVLEGSARSVVERLYKDTLGMMTEILGRLHREGLKDKAIEVMRKVLKNEVDIMGDDRDMVMKLAEYEIFFFDPVNREVRFQTRLDERAAKELLEVGR